jgi:hypothetical protein
MKPGKSEFNEAIDTLGDGGFHGGDYEECLLAGLYAVLLL